MVAAAFAACSRLRQAVETNADDTLQLRARPDTVFKTA